MSVQGRAVAALPRTLRLAPTTQISREHLLALYREQMRVANSFASYNFKHFFVRKARDKFRTELPPLLDAAYASPATSSSSTSSSASSGDVQASSSSSSAPSKDLTSSPESAARLREWYAEALSELAVLARASITNQMYEAPKLVVEGRGRAMSLGGGGAGGEAS